MILTVLERLAYLTTSIGHIWHPSSTVLTVSYHKASNPLVSILTSLSYNLVDSLVSSELELNPLSSVVMARRPTSNISSLFLSV